MDSTPTGNANEGLAVRYARLCESDAAQPDVFGFLQSFPDATLSEQIDVVTVDLKWRWRRGQPLPLRSYLTAFPSIAQRSDLVRLLIDTERNARREHAELPSLAEGPLASHASQASTHVLPSTQDQEQTIQDLAEPADHEVLLGEAPKEEHSPATTRDAQAARCSDDHLSFEIGPEQAVRFEWQTLVSMLDTIRFTLVKRLGAGGMGVVYEAYDRAREEFVALKTMRRVDPQALVRFKQEFRALCDISHPNLVNLYQLFAVNDYWFFTMELVEGCDFLTYVRNPHSNNPEPSAGGLEQADVTEARGLPFRENRLREALGQLAEGVHALHRASKLHRDIKPTNVLVTEQGRVVLLDFGLTADLEPSGRHRNLDRQIVGTTAHMSPEQAVGRSVSPASDWYSVGVILYQALTGKLPFEGSRDEVAIAKQTCVPASPETLVPGLPDDLVHLCMELLDRNPDRRPSASKIVEILRGKSQTQTDVLESNQAIPLIGRSRYLRVIDAVFTSLKNDRTETVFLFGRTGSGKTTLLQTFLDELMAADVAVVLTGRCYERESVPFKALDCLVDALARYLKRLPHHEVEALLPREVALLARVFPVLRSVEEVAAARRLRAELPDPQELRLRVLSSLRELFSRLGRERPLVLAIDDLQWGDVDSAVLLADIIHGPDPPALLFLGCFRMEDAEQSRFLQIFRQADGQRPSTLNLHELTVEALTRAESRELALALLGRNDPRSRAQAHLIARESGGNPLFINELVKHIQTGACSDAWDSPHQIDLDTVLWDRIRRQPDKARKLLEVVSVSGRPIHQSLAFTAAELGSGGRVALASLRTARLIRDMGMALRDQIETYHDRIRQTVVSHLPSESLRWYHHRLARVLESAGNTDPEALAVHFRGAGDNPRACEYFAKAADNAASALAFDQAIRLLRAALELHSGSIAETRGLRRKLGDALANAGRGSEAAQVYLDAAESAPVAETLELKRLASTQLLASGHVGEGLALLRTILGPLGLKMPRNRPAAVISLLWHRALLKLRGLRFRPRDETQISAEDLTRIDLCWAAVAGLSVVDPILSADFQTRALLMALRAGERFRIVRSLALEAAHHSVAGIRAADGTLATIGLAEDLATPIDSPQARGMIYLVRGISSLMVGEWKSSHCSFDLAERIFRNHCTGVTWERDTVHTLTLWSLLQMGEIAELGKRWAILIKEAKERGDLYAATTLTTFYMTMIKLAEDAPEEIEGEIEQVLACRPRQSFYIQQATAFRSLIHLDLYQERAGAAWQRVNAIWRRYRRSPIQRIQMVRILMHELHGRAALAVAEESSHPEPLLHMVERDARRLEREGQTWSVAHAHFLRAGIAACRQDSPRALHELGLSADLYASADMVLNAQVMNYRKGQIQSGDDGKTIIAETERYLRLQAVRFPRRWCEMYAPGFSNLIPHLADTKAVSESDTPLRL